MPVCCGKSFTSDASLLAHEQTPDHSTGASCPTCSTRFDTHELLAQHLREDLHVLSPQSLPEFHCVRCGRDWVDKQHYDNHQGLHEFRCDKCDLDCTSQVTLEIHHAMLHEQPVNVEATADDPSQPAAPPVTWFGTFRQAVTSVVKFTQVTHARILEDQRRVELFREWDAFAREEHAHEERARQALAREQLAREDLVRHRQQLARQELVREREAVAREELARETRARQALAQEQLLREGAARSSRARQESDIRRLEAIARLAATLESSRAHRPLRPTNTPADQAAAAGTWTGLFAPQPARTGQAPRSSALPNPVPAPRRSTSAIAPDQLAPAGQSRQPLTRQTPALTLRGPAAVQQARQPLTSSSAAPAALRVPPRIIPVPHSGARQPPHTTATPSIAPARIQQTAPVQRREPPTTRHPARAFPCTQCSRQFDFRAALDQHRSAVHARNSIPEPVARAREIPDAPRSTCMSCQKTFINQYALDQHLVSNAHPENQVDGQPGCRCVECGVVFATRDALTLHAAEHVRERMRSS